MPLKSQGIERFKLMGCSVFGDLILLYMGEENAGKRDAKTHRRARTVGVKLVEGRHRRRPLRES